MHNAFLPILVGWFPQSCVKSHWQNKRIMHLTFDAVECQPSENTWCIDFGFGNAVMSNQSLGLLFLFINEYEQLAVYYNYINALTCFFKKKKILWIMWNHLKKKKKKSLSAGLQVPTDIDTPGTYILGYFLDLGWGGKGKYTNGTTKCLRHNPRTVWNVTKNKLFWFGFPASHSILPSGFCSDYRTPGGIIGLRLCVEWEEGEEFWRPRGKGL